MDNDLISRSDLLNTKPEFLNEKVVRDTKYQTTKDRVYAKAWNACNDCWIDTIDNIPTVKFSLLPVDESKEEAYMRGYKRGMFKGFLKANTRPQGKWVGDTDYESYQGNYEAYKCSSCGYGLHWRDYCTNEYNFCPNCGADMRGGAE